ncbi:MAG: S8 family serine peptidase [Chloroflexota bacterium]|nr:S8 family serine peptidase [Chloroflexota bacterium]
MRRPPWIGLLWFVTASLAMIATPLAEAVAPAPGHRQAAAVMQTGNRVAGTAAEDRYIVTMREEAGVSRVIGDLRRSLDLEIDLEYEHALRGFAAKLTPAQVKELEANPWVLMVEPDIWLEGHDVSLPTGVDRIGADSTANGLPPTRAGRPVAVLDSGIANHPDLKVAGGYNCTSRDRGDFGDRNGHGTHVAGTIGARGGVAGVAPGTPIWGIKVLDDSNRGLLSWIICGLDWTTANQRKHGIVAINMSLGGPDHRRESASACGSSGFHSAICNTRSAGIAIVVSAGNEDKNAAGYTPAKFSQVITVAAMSDTDGCAGGRGPNSSWGSRDKDDRKWIRSNFGEAVDVIAPGVDIRSTVPGGYDVYSGTSMAAPHVTGAIALGWDPRHGPRERGIPGFGSDAGLVQLSENVACLGEAPPLPGADRPGRDEASPKLSLETKRARPGDTIAIRVRGYEAADQIRIRLNGKRAGGVAASERGSGKGRIRVPNTLKPGTYAVRANGAAGGSDAVRLRVRD